jgi:hypothetical protein
MNLQFYLEKLHNSEIFKKFMKENPNAFLCSGFFIIDKTGKEGNKQHFDYYVPKIKKMFSFKMEPKIEQVPIEMFEDKIPDKILVNYDFDFQDIEKKILREIEKKGIKTGVQKILLSLQKLDTKDFLVGTIFISALGIIKINISLPEKEIVKFEKKSFFDMVKIIKKKK